MLFFVPKAGLGNRIRGIASAYRLAEKINEQLTIIWIENHECNCPLFEIFTLPEKVKVIDIPWIPLPLSIRMHLQDVIRRHYSRKCEIIFKDDQLWDMKEDIVQSMAGKQVYLESAAGWDCETDDAFKIFSVNQEIQLRVREILQEASAESGPLVGVHIRRTDHSNAVTESPREAFVQAIEREIKSDENTRFYLASDDETEKQYFRNRFGSDRMITYSFELNREKPEGIRGAVIEALLLGAGSKIYGTKGSSYSQLAAALTGKPLITVTKEML